MSGESGFSFAGLSIAAFVAAFLLGKKNRQKGDFSAVAFLVFTLAKSDRSHSESQKSWSGSRATLAGDGIYLE